MTARRLAHASGHGRHPRPERPGSRASPHPGWHPRSAALGTTDLLALQRQAGNGAVGTLVVQRQPTGGGGGGMADQRRSTFPWRGETIAPYSAALRRAPQKDRDDPHRTTSADLPPGTAVWVVGHERGWLEVEVTVKGKHTTGYVSQELVKYVNDDQFVIDPKVMEDMARDQVTTERAFIILKQAEQAKAADPGYAPDAATKGRIENATWVLSGSGRWVVDPATYRVTLTGPRGRRIRLQSIEDFILFVEAVEREYPSATPQGVASEIRQLWFNSEAWRAMLDSRGIEAAGRAVDIETRPNPIAELFDMADLAPAGGGRKLFATQMGPVDISHVMTGIDSALSASPTGSDLKTRVLRAANRSDPRDFATWSGDLGQAYAHYLVRRWANGDTRANLQQYVDAEAQTEALLGDIHGYVATQVWRDLQGHGDPIGGALKVSSVLRTLYLLDKPAVGTVTYQAYVERLTGKKSTELRDHILERALAFAPFEYAKEVTSDWGNVKKGWEGATSGGEAGVLADLVKAFERDHRLNEASAGAPDKLGGLVDHFLRMLAGELR